MVDLGNLAEGLSTFLGPALRSFFKTIAGMLVLGLVIAGPCYYLAAQDIPWRGAVAAFTAMGFAIGFGIMLAGKRAALVGLSSTLGSRHLGRAAVDLLFSRLAGLSDKIASGRETSPIPKAVERLPLAQAEQRLKNAITELIGAPGKSGGVRGWLKRSAQTMLMSRVEDLTLAHFREASEGGVDLVKMRTELAASVDAELVDRLASARWRTTLFVLALVVVLSFAGALALRLIPIDG